MMSVFLLAGMMMIGEGKPAEAADVVSFAPGITFSGAPSYVSEFMTRFRDNGGPLSPFGSHIGLKAEVRELGFAGVEHYACATGQNVLDYSRTGLALVSTVRLLVHGETVPATARHIRFEYFGWEETASFPGFRGRARVHFLGLNQYLISVVFTNESEAVINLTPLLRLERRGRQLKQEKTASEDPLLFSFAVQPTTTPGKSFLALLSSFPLQGQSHSDRKGFFLQGPQLSLPAHREIEFWFIFGFSADAGEEAQSLVRAARESLAGPAAAWEKMRAEREAFFASLPAPHLAAGEEAFQELYLLAAAALANALYAPRGAMKSWACVPTKVHYNWFWLWDSGFQALGYSEFAPERSRDVIRTMFAAQKPDGFIAHMTDERLKALTPHSQPPVFGWSAGKFIARYPHDPEMKKFISEMYERSQSFLAWWKNNRDRNGNGLFEYLSQDEGGWDNSPRAAYVPRLMFISYYGFLGELIGAKVKPLDNVDLNAWMFSYYRAMERWAGELGRSEEAAAWRAEALALAERIDAGLWDEECGCWLDTWSWRGSGRRQSFRVLTPHIWFPAFTGATRDEKKARTVIEQHLLNPAEFFGKYPIPVVAYNDPAFDNTTPGWTASIWLITAYSALEALWRFGYEAEAAELRERLLTMMAEQGGMKGIYETYDPETGQYKNEYSTDSYTSAQFGWSAAFTLQIILDRWQEERFVFADTRKIQGFIRRAEAFETREDFYRLEAGREVPRLELSAVGGEPLLSARAVRIRLSDPGHIFPEGVRFRSWVGGRRFEVGLDEEKVLELN